MRYKDIYKKLSKAGFERVRTGDHHIYRHPDGRWTPVSKHKTEEVPIGTLRNIEKLTKVKLR